MAQKKRDDAEIEALRCELPLNPPQTVLETIKQRQKSAKLVYRAGFVTEPTTGLKSKAALVRCTACGEKYYLDHTYAGTGCHAGGYGDSFGFIDPLDHEAKCTGTTCICPECGAEAEALHISHIRGTYIVDKTYFLKYTISGGISSPSPGSCSRSATKSSNGTMITSTRTWRRTPNFCLTTSITTSTKVCRSHYLTSPLLSSSIMSVPALQTWT